MDSFIRANSVPDELSTNIFYDFYITEHNQIGIIFYPASTAAIGGGPTHVLKTGSAAYCPTFCRKKVTAENK